MPAKHLARLRRICLALPEAHEVETWGEATFRVGEKMFAVAASDGSSFSCKATKEDQAELVAANPHISVAHYVGRFGWVSVKLAAADWGEVEELVRDSYRLIAPKRLAKLV